jgi:hypothetical protein
MVASKPNLVNLEPRPSLDVARPSGQSSGRSRIQAAQLSSEDFWRAALPLISGAMSSALRAGQVQLAARIRRTVETLEPPGLKRSSISPVNWPISGEGRCGFQSGRGLEADRRKRGLSTHVQVGKGRKIPIVQGLKPATWQPHKPPYGKEEVEAGVSARADGAGPDSAGACAARARGGARGCAARPAGRSNPPVRRSGSSRPTIRSTTSFLSTVITSPPPNAEPPGPGLSSYGPRSAVSQLPRRPSSTPPFCSPRPTS